MGFFKYGHSGLVLGLLVAFFVVLSIMALGFSLIPSLDMLSIFYNHVIHIIVASNLCTLRLLRAVPHVYFLLSDTSSIHVIFKYFTLHYVWGLQHVVPEE